MNQTRQTLYYRTFKLLFCLVSLLSTSVEAAERPNILWLVSEDTSASLIGCYGNQQSHTPTIDQLAREGIVYERCFTCPVCAPSRFSLITGMYPTSCGPAHHMRASGKITPEIRGFPALLSEAGYYTTNNAKTDYNAPIKIKDTWTQSGRMAHWRNHDQGQPFFSVFNFDVCHESCLFPEKEMKLDFEPISPAEVKLPAYQPDTPEMRADWVRQLNRIRVMDSQLAAMLKELHEAGKADDTIVFYYGDNGGVTPRSKRCLQASGTNVPLVIYFPPKWRHLAPAAPGSRVTDPVQFVDLGPTVLSLAGVKAPSRMHGRAFAGEAKQPLREFVFVSRDRMDELYDMSRMVADQRWLYIRNFRPDVPYVQPLDYPFRARGYQSWARLATENKLTEATKQFWGTKPSEELYDLANDPDNVRNLAMSTEHATTLQRFRAALREHVIATRDNGFLPEGSNLEGYASPHSTPTWPVGDVYDLACAASDRDAKNLSRFIAALTHESEPMRWWGAQGCTLLGPAAAEAIPALEKASHDAAGGVAIAAAEALAGCGRVDLALPILEQWATRAADAPNEVRIASNVLVRLGELARPSLPVMQRAIAPLRNTATREHPPQQALSYAVETLEGQRPALVYPK